MNSHDQAILLDTIGQLPQRLTEGLVLYVAVVGIALLLGLWIWRK